MLATLILALQPMMTKMQHFKFTFNEDNSGTPPRLFTRHRARHRLAGQFGTVRTESEYTGRTCVVGFLIANSFRDFCVLYV